jgi:hypothetical protein
MLRPLALMIVLGLAACAAPPPLGQDAVLVAPGVTLALPDARALGRDVTVRQLVEARRPGDTQLFEVLISIQGDNLTMAATDSLGRRAMTIRRQGSDLAVERAAWLPDQLQATHILADLALIYWPPEALRPGLAGAELKDQGGRRRLGEAVEIESPGWNGTSRLHHHAWEYDLTIQSVELAP